MINISRYNLKLVKENGRRYDLDKTIKKPEHAKDIFNQVLNMDCQAEEVFAIISLDIKNQITGVFEVSRGNISGSLVTPREVFKRAILANSVAIIMGHNHPSGICSPSSDDIKVTKKLMESGKILGIEVLDHVIVGSNNWLSMKTEGVI